MIRKAAPEDGNRLAEIHVYGWRYTYRGLISDDILFKSMNVVNRAQSFIRSLEDNNEETYVFDENGIVKAFMTIGKSRDQDKLDAYELWGLYADPLMLRNGIGTCMIQYLEEKAKQQGYSEIILWVLEKNLIGRNFYSKMGYEPEGARKTLERFNIEEVRLCKKL